MLRTDAFHVRFLRLGFSFAGVVLLSAAACPTASDDAGCGPAGVMNLHSNDVAALLSSPDLETSFSGGVRTFSWSRLVENVCSDEHVKASWILLVQPSKVPPGWRVDAGYLLTALVGRDVTPTITNPTSSLRQYKAETEIGLKQSFEGRPGQFVPFLDISFTSRGDLSEDRAVVRDLVVLLDITANYKQHKTD